MSGKNVEQEDHSQAMITRHTTGCLYFLSFLMFSKSSTSSPPGQCQEWSLQKQEQEQSLYVSFGSGRLGARMTPYTLLMIFKEKHGLNVMVDKEIKDWIKRYFMLPRSESIPVLEEYFCPQSLARLKAHMTNYTENDPQMTGQHILEYRDQGRVVNLWPEGPEETSSYWVPDAMLTAYGTFIREEFIFRPEYQKHVDNMFKTIKKNDKSGKEVIFVGLHSRRTDYLAFSKKMLKKSVVGKTYFLEGIEYFQEEFPESQVYFMAVSDDMRWMAKHLGGIDGVVLAGAASVVDTGLDPIGVDLCILASCNHSIVSQGQFGQWGAFLAAGDIFSEYGAMVRSVLSD